jgi:hypothetical protein
LNAQIEQVQYIKKEKEDTSIIGRLQHHILLTSFIVGKLVFTGPIPLCSLPRIHFLYITMSRFWLSYPLVYLLPDILKIVG